MKYNKLFHRLSYHMFNQIWDKINGEIYYLLYFYKYINLKLKYIIYISIHHKGPLESFLSLGAFIFHAFKIKTRVCPILHLQQIFTIAKNQKNYLRRIHIIVKFFFPTLIKSMHLIDKPTWNLYIHGKKSLMKNMHNKQTHSLKVIAWIINKNPNTLIKNSIKKDRSSMSSMLLIFSFSIAAVVFSWVKPNKSKPQFGPNPKGPYLNSSSCLKWIVMYYQLPFPRKNVKMTTFLHLPFLEGYCSFFQRWLY